MAGFGELATRLLGNAVNTASNATNKTLNTPLQQKDGSKNQPQTIGDFLQAIQQKRPAAQPQQPAANEMPVYIAPQATPQTAAPASQEKKESDNKKDQERKSFNDTIARMIPGALTNNTGMMLANATTPKKAKTTKTEKSAVELKGGVDTEGSNDAAERERAAKSASDEQQDILKAAQEKEKDNRENQASNINFNPRSEPVEITGDFFTNLANSYANAAFMPTAPDNTVDRTIPTIGAGNPGYATPWREQYLYNSGLMTPKELVQQANAGKDISVGNDVSLQGARQSGALQDAINRELGTAINEITSTAQKAAEAGDDIINDNQLYYGLTRDQINQMYEDAIYNAAMEDQAYRQLFNDAGYGDLYGSYAAYGSLGDTTDYSSRRDVTRDIFGLGGSNPDLEIQGLKDIYLENGTINKDMTDDEMLDAILEAHWGAGNIINPYQWMSDEAYQAANPFGGSSAGQGYADYWLENGVIPVDESGVFGGLEGDWSKLDNEDFSALVAAGNIINQLNAGWRPTDADMDAMSQVFQNAGDLSSFAYLPTDNSESEYKGREWNANQRANAYAMAQLLQAMAAAEGGDYSGLTPYVDSNMALGDAYMTDTVAKAIENSTGKKVGRKDR